MKQIDLFTTPIWCDTIPSELDTSWLVDMAYELKADNELNDCNGWQSFDQKNEMMYSFPIPKGLKLQQYLDSAVNNIAKELGLPMVSLLNYWLNINPTGGYNNLHKHRNSLLVGNLYLQVPDSTSGGIEFVRDDDTDYYVPPDAEYHPVIGTRKTINPNQGDIIIFPGWLPHSVKTNKSTQDRISLSFNYGAIK